MGNPEGVFQGLWEGGRRPAFHGPAGARPGRGGCGGRGGDFPQIHSRVGGGPPTICRMSKGDFTRPTAPIRQPGATED